MSEACDNLRRGSHGWNAVEPLIATSTLGRRQCMVRDETGIRWTCIGRRDSLSSRVG